MLVFLRTLDDGSLCIDGFKSDLRSPCAIVVQPRLYVSAMVTQITLDDEALVEVCLTIPLPPAADPLLGWLRCPAAPGIR